MKHYQSVIAGLARGILLTLALASFAFAAGPSTVNAPVAAKNCANCPHGVCAVSSAMNAKDCPTCPYGIKNCPGCPICPSGSAAGMKPHSSTNSAQKKSAAHASTSGKASVNGQAHAVLSAK